MAPNPIVRAEVVNVGADTPTTADAFLVDTNVWYWMAYQRASQSDKPAEPWQTQDYPRFIQRALAAKARLHWSGFSLAELAHRIEATEYEIFRRTNVSLFPKEYRHTFPNERANTVVPEIGATWAQVKQWRRRLISCSTNP